MLLLLGMRFQVPQFVDIEDKIIGPLTLRQFLIYFGAVVALIPIYLVTDISLFLTIALPVLGLAALFAHFRLNGRTLFRVIVSAIGFFSRGQLYLWRRTGHDKPVRLDSSIAPALAAPESDSSPLSAVARQLETQGNTVKSDLGPEEDV